MLVIWLYKTILILMMLIYLLYTIVFIFWSIYLIDAVKRKRIYYKTTLRWQQRNDLHQQTLAYNAKTQMVKYSFLFCINLVEWFACTFSAILSGINMIKEYNSKTSSINISSDSEYLTNATVITTKQFHLNLPNFPILCMILSVTLIGSLCMYLAARYAHKSWIKPNSIPYWISFFILSSILTQFLVSLCYTSVIGVWCEAVLLTLCVIFSWKQYRKLSMVMNWSIVDLQVDGRKRLLLKQINMKRRFTGMFIIIWIAVFFFLASSFTESILQTILVFFPFNDDSTFIDSLSCVILQMSTHDHLNTIIYYIEYSFASVGFLIFFIPYICIGLVEMFIMLWRLCKGTTGYRTHFHNKLYDPLI